jgi:hypothetical protein
VTVSFADLKRRSREKLHAAMSFHAIYYGGPTFEPVPVMVRTHIKSGALQGDLKGTNLSYAEQIEAPTKLILLESDVPAPLRGDRIVLSPQEGYEVDLAHPPYRGTVTVEVTPLDGAALASLEGP